MSDGSRRKEHERVAEGLTASREHLGHSKGGGGVLCQARVPMPGCPYLQRDAKEELPLTSTQLFLCVLFCSLARPVLWLPTSLAGSPPTRVPPPPRFTQSSIQLSQRNVFTSFQSGNHSSKAKSQRTDASQARERGRKPAKQAELELGIRPRGKHTTTQPSPFRLGQFAGTYRGEKLKHLHTKKKEKKTCALLSELKATFKNLPVIRGLHLFV